MSTKKVYFILLVLIIILIFTSAAICSNCTNATAISSTESTGGSGQSSSSTESAGVSSTSSEGQGSSSTKGGDTSSTSQGATTSTSSSEAGSPTVTLAIYEGPNYSPADNIYYFRVEATVTGSPKPSVTWSKDDSNSAWGNKKAQVNMNPGETYTLKATAKNSVGTASANIILTAPGTSSSTIAVNHAPDVADITVPGGALYVDAVHTVSAVSSDSDGDTLAYAWSSTGGTWVDSNVNPAQWKAPAAAGDYTLTLNVDDGNGGVVVRTADITVVPVALINLIIPIAVPEGGYVENGGITNAGGCVYAGDTAANKFARGYMSYNITSLAGATIDSAILTFTPKKIYGNPTEHAGSAMVILVVDYGPVAISQATLGTAGISLGGALTPAFTYAPAALKTHLQNAINAGKQRFQLGFGFTDPNFDNDGVWDGWEYDQTGITLSIKYKPAP